MSETYCPHPVPPAMTCLRCGRVCEPTRFGWRHAKARCGVWMRNSKEPCARYEGHRGNHSTRYAMDNAMTARRAA